MAGQHTFTVKAAFLEDVRGSSMIDVTQGVQAGDLELSCQRHHGAQRLSGESLAPGVAREYVPGHRAVRSLHHDTCTPEQRAVLSIERQQRAYAPACPLGHAEPDKRLGVANRLVAGPTQIACHLGIRGVALEDRCSILRCRRPEQESLCLDD